MDEFDIDVSTVDPEEVELRDLDLPPTFNWRKVTFKRDLDAYTGLRYWGESGGCEIRVSRTFYLQDMSWGDWEAAILPYPKGRMTPEFMGVGKTPYQALDRMMDKWLDKFEPWVRLAMSK